MRKRDFIKALEAIIKECGKPFPIIEITLKKKDCVVVGTIEEIYKPNELQSGAFLLIMGGTKSKLPIKMVRSIKKAPKGARNKCETCLNPTYCEYCLATLCSPRIGSSVCEVDLCECR